MNIAPGYPCRAAPARRSEPRCAAAIRHNRRSGPRATARTRIGQRRNGTSESPSRRGPLLGRPVPRGEVDVLATEAGRKQATGGFGGSMTYRGEKGVARQAAPIYQESFNFFGKLERFRHRQTRPLRLAAKAKTAALTGPARPLQRLARNGVGFQLQDLCSKPRSALLLTAL